MNENKRMKVDGGGGGGGGGGDDVRVVSSKGNFIAFYSSNINNQAPTSIVRSKGPFIDCTCIFKPNGTHSVSFCRNVCMYVRNIFIFMHLFSGKALSDFVPLQEK